MSGTPCGWLNSAADDDSPNSSRAIPASTISRRRPGEGGSRWACFVSASSCACFHEPTLPALPSFSPSIHTLQTSPRCPDRRFSWTCITGLGSDIRCPSHLAEGEDYTDGAFNARPVSLTLDPCGAGCEPQREVRVGGIAVRGSAAARGAGRRRRGERVRGSAGERVRVMAQTVTYGSRAGRWVLLATILASGIAQLDATVVNVALPRIGRDLHVGLTSLQWTVNAYTLTLSGLLLLGGSLGDRLGRRRIFVFGVIWFTAASLGCALAPSAGVLIAMRAVQGIGGAMLTPGSLAILQAVFAPDDRAPAVGAWSGLTGVASALGPVVGGLLVGVAPWGWRLVFLLNLPLAVVVVLASRHIPETRDESVDGR